MEIRTNIKPLVYMAFGLAFVVLIGIITLHKPELEYKMSIGQIHKYILNHSDEISPADAMEIAEEGRQGYQFIDLRNEYEFAKAHINNSINIPEHSLLMKLNIESLKAMDADSITIILYGSDQLQANGPWMILKQLGFNQVKVLIGGYASLRHQGDSTKSAIYTKHLLSEDAWYDYQGLIDSVVADHNTILPDADALSAKSTPTPKPKPEPLIPVRKPGRAVEGGC